jgi:hypothetical protein
MESESLVSVVAFCPPKASQPGGKVAAPYAAGTGRTFVIYRPGMDLRRCWVVTFLSFDAVAIPINLVDRFCCKGILRNRRRAGEERKHQSS